MGKLLAVCAANVIRDRSEFSWREMWTSTLGGRGRPELSRREMVAVTESPTSTLSATFRISLSRPDTVTAAAAPAFLWERQRSAMVSWASPGARGERETVLED